jgi:hypothetical protein
MGQTDSTRVLPIGARFVILGFSWTSWVAMQQYVKQANFNSMLSTSQGPFSNWAIKHIYTLILATVCHSWPCSFGLPSQHVCHTTVSPSCSIPWTHSTGLVPGNFFYCTPPCSPFPIPQLLASSDKRDCLVRQCYQP